MPESTVRPRASAPALSVARVLAAQGRRTLAIVPLLVIAGAAEGFGLLTLLPILESVSSPATPSPTARAILGLLARLRLPATLPVLLLSAMAALLLKAALRWLAMAWVARTVADVAAGLRTRLVGALLGARWHHFQTEPAGALATAVGRDALWAAQAYRDACSMLAAAIQLAAYAVAVMLVSWKLGLAALAAVLVVGLPLAPWIRASRRAGTALTRHGAELASRLVDALRAMKPIKAMAREEAFARLLADDIRALRTAEEHHVRATEAMRAAQEPLLAAVVLGGFFLATSSGRLSVPTLVLLLVLFQRVASRWQVVQSEHQAVAGALGAVAALEARTRAALSQRERIAGLPAPALVRGLSLAGLRYTHDERLVLDDVVLTVSAGDFVAIVGRSGAGKTTLLDLVAGLREPAAGEIRVDGVPLREIAPPAWRAHLGYVPQESVLLHDTLAANVTLGRSGLAAEEVERALRDAGAAPLLAGLPAGIDTVVGEAGVRLSGGERRRVALARALVGRPALLLLDEATSELDAASAAAIAQTLRALRGRMTILAVTHHRELAAAADAVYALEAGRLHPLRTAVQVAS